MHKEFEKIIGYEAVKHELDQLCDVLSNPEKYRKLGVMEPSGLILYGKPGLGKSLMADCLIKATGRKAFACRKDLPNGEFVKKIRSTFEEAQASAPSIVLLDDMDKFANGDYDHPDSEEYVTVQSCIDQVKGKHVFVLATANSLRNLPDSLLRSGRFDREIHVKRPSGEEASAITKHYLMSKPIHPDVDIDLIARIMDGCSCAELESVINEAGLCAAYSGSDSIKMDHFLEACLPIVFDAPGTRCSEDAAWVDTLPNAASLQANIAYHEAGHAVVGEMLRPRSVTLVSVFNCHGRAGGFTAHTNHDDNHLLPDRVDEIMIALGGIASIEQKFGVRSTGGTRDLTKAFDMMRELVVDQCVYGMEYYTAGEDSEHRKAMQEDRISTEVERLYQQAKSILTHNMPLVEAVAHELAVNGVITAHDIARLKNDLNSAGNR